MAISTDFTINSVAEQRDIATPADTSINNGIDGLGIHIETGQEWSETSVSSGVIQSILTHAASGINIPQILSFSAYATAIGSGHIAVGSDVLYRFLIPSGSPINTMFPFAISGNSVDDLTLQIDIASSGDIYTNANGFNSDGNGVRLNQSGLDPAYPDENRFLGEEVIALFNSFGQQWIVNQQFDAASGSIIFGNDANIRPDIYYASISSRVAGEANLYINDSLVQKIFIEADKEEPLISSPIYTSVGDEIKLEGIMSSGIFALNLFGFDSKKGFS